MKKQDLIQEKDYKQLYEDALNKVKELQKDWKSTGNRAAKEIEVAFPQLAEPKDEQTRKAILNHMKMYAKINGVKSFDTISTEDILDYLERIKEPIVEKVIYIPKFRLGNLVVSTNNRDLTYHILGTKKSEQGVDCYVTDTFKSGVFACTNLMPIESMDEWGELVAENFDNEQQDRSSMVEALRLEYEKGRADAIAEGDVIKSVKINGLPPVTGNKTTDIRPWKPTEEQLDYLSAAYADRLAENDTKGAEALGQLHDELVEISEDKTYFWDRNDFPYGASDETILKALISLINWSGTPWSTDDKDKYIEFLERIFNKSANYDHEMWKNCEANFEGGKAEVINNPEKYGLSKQWDSHEYVRKDTIWKPTKGQLESIRWLLEDYSPWLISSRDAREDLETVYNELRKLLL